MVRPAGRRRGPDRRPVAPGRGQHATGAGPGGGTEAGPRRRRGPRVVPGQHDPGAPGPPASGDRRLRADAGPVPSPRTVGPARSIRTGCGWPPRNAASSPRTVASCSSSWRGPASDVARGDRPTLVRSLALLDEAEAIRGLAPSKALWLDRASYFSQLGDAERAGASPRPGPTTIPATGRPRPLSPGHLVRPARGRRRIQAGDRRAERGPEPPAAALLVGAATGDLPHGAGRVRPGARRFRHLHRPVAGAPLGLFQSGLRAGPHGPEGRRHQRLHGRAGTRPAVRGRPGRTAASPGWSSSNMGRP